MPTFPHHELRSPTRWYDEAYRNVQRSDATIQQQQRKVTEMYDVKIWWNDRRRGGAYSANMTADLSIIEEDSTLSDEGFEGFTHLQYLSARANHGTGEATSVVKKICEECTVGVITTPTPMTGRPLDVNGMKAWLGRLGFTEQHGRMVFRK